MAKLKLTQVKSAIHRPKDQKATLIALGIKRMHQTVEKESNPVIMGMVNKVKHMLEITEVK